jgi:hypothetical protein
MRKLLLVLLFCAGGYWLYSRYFVSPRGAIASGSEPAPDEQTGFNFGRFSMPDPVAWKQVNTYSFGTKIVLVALVDGNRWRTESRKLPSPKIYVSVFDGLRFVTSNPEIMYNNAEPRPIMEANFSEWSKSTPLRTEECDGHSCWLFTDGPDAQGNKGESWIDKETRFPVLLTEWSGSGVRGDEHFQLLKSDFNILRATCFDTRNTAPMMAPFLSP